MSQIIECVPNFSEGRDLNLVEDIVAAVKSVKVLDVHSDPDHNRSVVTMLGSPSEIKQAAFQLTERAMQLLDIRDHQGVHPFIGVVDVIPFIPLKNISHNETVVVAREFGQELWSKLQLPVYFYGAAANIESRRDLPNVRRGGYSILKQEIDRPERRPDVGQGLHVTAGAVAVGVRDFLIAYNVNLDTSDILIAQSIAKNIREKSGGLLGVRALGLELLSRGITQVSINIVDHKKTSMLQVFNAVKKWAHEYQVKVVESEIVGMIPPEAVFDNMKEQLLLRQPPRILPY
jgi:glutamate formiminotransferase